MGDGLGQDWDFLIGQFALPDTRTAVLLVNQDDRHPAWPLVGFGGGGKRQILLRSNATVQELDKHTGGEEVRRRW